MSEAPRVYVDTCGFVNLVKTEVGHSLNSDKEADAWYLKRLLEANRDGEVEVFTSTLTIAESTHVGLTPVPGRVQHHFNRLLMSGQYVKLVQLSPFVASDARDLRWKHNINLKGADAAHLASAISMNCQEFITTNGRFTRIEEHHAALSKLGLEPIESRNTKLIPSKYLQLRLDDQSD